MVLGNPLLGADVAEHVQLLLVFSAHLSLTSLRCGNKRVFLIPIEIPLDWPSRSWRPVDEETRKATALLAVSCLVCVIIALRNTDGLEGTEFSGGWLTGPLLSMIDIGTVLFVLALILTFIYPRIAGGDWALASSLLCLPLYLYFIAPVTLNQIFGFGHQFKSRTGSGGLHWDRWPIAGVLTLAATRYVCLRGFAVTSRTQIQERG